MRTVSLFGMAVGAAVFLLAATPRTAEAALVTQLKSGNDCGSPGCFATESGSSRTAGGSPFIIKFDVPGNGTPGADQIVKTISGFEWWITINPAYASLTGDEFTFTSNGPTGTWTYSPTGSDPLIKFWAAKGGPDHNFFYDNGGTVGGPAVVVSTGEWTTPANCGQQNNQCGLSHLTFWNTKGDNGTPIPEPATLGLLGMGLLGLAAAARRRRKDA